MRLLDADELKEWMANWIKMDHYYHPYACNDIPINELEDIIERMPTVDAVPVIRCKDCMFYQKDRGKFMAQKFRSGDGICKMHNYAKVTAAKDFCSWAKREE